MYTCKLKFRYFRELSTVHVKQVKSGSFQSLSIIKSLHTIYMYMYVQHIGVYMYILLIIYYIHTHECDPYLRIHAVLSHLLCFSNTDTVLDVVVHVAQVRIIHTQNVHQLLSGVDRHFLVALSISANQNKEVNRRLDTCRHTQVHVHSHNNYACK